MSLFTHLILYRDPSQFHSHPLSLYDFPVPNSVLYWDPEYFKFISLYPLIVLPSFSQGSDKAAEQPLPELPEDRDAGAWSYQRVLGVEK